MIKIIVPGNNDLPRSTSEERIMSFSKVILRRNEVKEIMGASHIERGYARPNNPSHWVFLDTESGNDIL